VIEEADRCPKVGLPDVRVPLGGRHVQVPGEKLHRRFSGAGTASLSLSTSS
jgi:hypothetical protein